MKIKNKMFLVFGLSVFFIVSVLSFGIYLFVEGKVKNGLDNEINNTINAAKNSVSTLESIAIKNYLRAITEKDKDVIAFFYKQYEKGEISKEALKAKASEVILSKKIGKTGYVAGVSSNGILSIHPKAEGVSIANTSFWPKVDRLVRSKNHSGFLEYDWKNPNETKVRKKAGYITYFKPMDLIIWASSYREEFSELIRSEDLHDAILALKVGKNGYPFIVDSQGKMLIHPNPNLEGKNVYNLESNDGQKIIQKMISEKNGQFDYDWEENGVVRSKIVLFSYLPAKDMVVAMSAYKDERYSLLNSIRNGLILAFIASMATIMVVVLFFSSMITNPIIKGVKFSETMSGGDFTGKLDITQKDEIGQLAVSLNNMTEVIGKIFRQVMESVENLAVSSEDLAGISHRMSGDSTLMKGDSNTLSEAASEMNLNLESISSASDRVMDNISSVATAIEQMSGTINEIAKNSEIARTISDKAVTITGEASELVDALGKAAFEINHVTETIEEISEQTNLLALNATIEAARAGEAGKGFAVVANEIKDLAGQTSNSTREIQLRINEVQNSTQGTVLKIKDISKIINEVNDIVAGIAASVEEQSATAGEISENMHKTTSDLQEVNHNVFSTTEFSKQITEKISGVNKVASEMESSSLSIDQNSKSFLSMAEDVKSMLSRFRV